MHSNHAGGMPSVTETRFADASPAAGRRYRPTRSDRGIFSILCTLATNAARRVWFPDRFGPGRRIDRTEVIEIIKSPAGEAFIHGGTEWETIDFPILGGNICMGSWQRVGCAT